MHHYHEHFGGMHAMWWGFWLILLVFILVLSRYVSFGLQKKDSPLDILKNRFAKGEISKEEYEEAKKILTSNNK